MKNNSVPGPDALADANMVTRFAPSPTGRLHIGSARTALFSYLLARQHQGKFILRIEDTDRNRSLTEHEQDIVSGLEWLSLHWDEFYRQSEREELYHKYLEQMIEDNTAYISEEKVKVGENKRSQVIRFRNPNTEISFQDQIRGEITFDTTELGDFVIARSLTEPLFHLSVVIDDGLMNISHIIRGEDHISNTPRQILLQQALGFDQPVYAHIPLILAPNRAKLSKRQTGVRFSTITELRDFGYLPDALINFLALLGWNPGTDEELFQLQELVEFFNLNQVQKSGAVFNQDKLDWINRSHLSDLSQEEHINSVSHYLEISQRYQERSWQIDKSYTREIWSKILQERISVYGEITELVDGGELDYLFEQPEYEPQDLIWKQTDRSKTVEHLQTVHNKLSGLASKMFNQQSVKDALWDYATEQGRGEVLWPLRYALSGLDRSPDPFTLAEVLGQKTTLERIDRAVRSLSNNSDG